MADQIPGGRIDWTKVGGSTPSTTPTRPPALQGVLGSSAVHNAPSGTGGPAAPGGRIDWTKVGSTPQAATSAAPSTKGKGIFSRIVSDAKAGLGGLVHLPAAAANDVETFAGAATGQNWGNAGIKQQPGESLSEFSARKYPLLGGALVQGPVTLYEHVRHPTQAARDYSAHPLLGPLGDIGTAAIFAGPALKAASAAGEGAAEGSTLAKVAKGADVAHQSLENAANPIRPLLNGVGPVPGLRAIPERAFQAVQEGSNDTLTRVAAKLAKPMHQTSAAILEGQANEAAGKGVQARLGKLLTGIISDPNEQAAALEVGQQTAPALAALRAHLSPEQFAAYVEDRYKGTLSPQAAHLAADVVEGKNPELAGRVDAFLKAYHDANGGQGERTAAFLAKPGHDYQAGYEPNPAAVKGAVDEASKGLPRLQKLAVQARARADAAAFDAAGTKARVAEGVPTERISALANRSAAASDTAARAMDKGLASTIDKRAVAEGAYGRLAGTLQKVADTGATTGKAEMRARVFGNIADQAEARVGKIQTAAERARVNAEQAVENAPARLKPALAENRAAGHALVGIVNDLRKRGLNDSAAQVEDAIGKLPTDLAGLKSQGVDAEHFFHTQDNAGAKGGMAKGQTLPRTFTAGSEKLRTGSPVYDRTVAGQMRGAEEAMRASARQATADKIGTMPFAARLGNGPLEGVHNTEEALAKGYVPWSSSAIFDKAGKVRPLDHLDEALSIEHPQVFLPKPVFDEFRNYFEPRRGQVLGAFLDPANRIRFMANLALKPGYIVARVFGHAMLGLAGTSDPIAFGKNLLEAYQQWKGSAEDIGQRYFPETPPRLLHGQADSAEYARMVSDTGPGKGRLGPLADKIPGKGLTDLGTKVLHRPMQLASFMDNVQRTAFYLTEKSKVGEEQALESSLRALGEFDRATPLERDYIRRIIPFWQWHKELTRIAFHLAEDHPLRVAWTLHLGNLVSKPDDSVGDPWTQALHLGPYSVDAGSLSPFNQVPDTFGGGAFGVGKIAGTVPQLAYGAVTGEKATTGKPFTGPPGSAQTVRPTAPSLMHLFGQTLPQVRLWDALSGRDKNQRYDTGDLKIPASNHYRPLPNQYGTGLGQLSQFLGLPVQRTDELKADNARYTKAKAKAVKQGDKSAQRYKTRLGKLTP